MTVRCWPVGSRPGRPEPTQSRHSGTNPSYRCSFAEGGLVGVTRRTFLLVAGGLLVTPVIAQESSRIYTVGVLFGGGEEPMAMYRAGLVERLAKHGFVEHRNLRLEARTGGTGDDRARVRELVALKPDALMTCLTRGTLAAKEVAASIPIVFAWVADPVAAGFVQSYARPGGNISGVTSRYGELLIKRLELARELLPQARRIAVISDSPGAYPPFAPRLQQAAAQLGVELMERNIFFDWGTSVEEVKAAGADALVPFQMFVATGMRMSGEAVVAASLKHRMPVIFSGVEMVEAGGLMSYGTNLVEDVRRAADILARVLKGANPATIPVDQASRFELVVNLKTAKALGLTIPRSILLRADRVIE